MMTALTRNITDRWRQVRLTVKEWAFSKHQTLAQIKSLSKQLLSHIK